MKELWTLIKWLFSKPSDFDEMEIVQMKHFPFSGYSAMTWCGRLVTRKDPSKINQVTKTHESIHLKQAQKVGSWWKFYLKYLGYWIKGLPFTSAYYLIPYEMEAYANENDTSYPVNYDGTNLSKYISARSKKKFDELGSVYQWKQYLKNL
jgi:hypothetical protein